MALRSQLAILVLAITFASANYWEDRRSFIEMEEAQAVGGSIELNQKEREVNAILMHYKKLEYDNGFQNPGNFSAANHIFDAVHKIEQSCVYKIIKKLPKGCSLHSHDTALTSGEYLYNITYRDNLYACVQNGRLRLQFFSTPDTTCDWELLSSKRASNSTFDDFLKTQINIIVDDPHYAYPQINKVWSAFINTFITVTPMLTYRPVWQDYFYQVLKELYEDNVMYIEFRGTLPQVYELNGTTYDPVGVAGLYVETLARFKADYPKFQGARFIYAPLRAVDNSTMDQYVNTTLRLKSTYPDFIAGFDLVGQEDLGQPLTSFINQLQELKSQGIKFFFHSGETNWFGTSTDFNLVDAIFLETVRIGHGYALMKHPELLKVVKEREIAIEVNPISNQVLKLIDDYRNHPANFFISHGYPVVICNDDPSFWGTKALSHDWYIAFMGLASRNFDLKLLKQLALNSYLYNVMPEDEKDLAIQQWNASWNQFLDAVLADCGDCSY